VREAVRDESMSDSEILAVLQCCDYSVERTITALLEGLISGHAHCQAVVSSQPFLDQIYIAGLAVSSSRISKEIFGSTFISPW